MVPNNYLNVTFMEIFVVRISNPVDNHFIDLRIPSGSFEVIARWFLNDFNSYEIKIINRYLCKPDGSPVGGDSIDINVDF